MSSSKTLMIALAGLNFSAKHVIRHRGVAENERYDEECADQDETHALWRRGGLADRDRRGNDVGPKTDGKAGVAQEQEKQRKTKRRSMSFFFDDILNGDCRDHDEHRHRRKQDNVGK